jgi:hypothetical protein
MRLGRLRAAFSFAARNVLQAAKIASKIMLLAKPRERPGEHFFLLS